VNYDPRLCVPCLHGTWSVHTLHTPVHIAEHIQDCHNHVPSSVTKGSHLSRLQTCLKHLLAQLATRPRAPWLPTIPAILSVPIACCMIYIQLPGHAASKLPAMMCSGNTGPVQIVPTSAIVFPRAANHT
jgi:hypothetical protein